MTNTDENSARVREFLAYRSPVPGTLYSMSSQSTFDSDDAFFETVEIMGNSKEYYLQNRTALMND